jgi:hypothetical protein
MKTDYEMLRELIDKFKTADTNRADKLTIMKDLEYYVHQVEFNLENTHIIGFSM